MTTNQPTPCAECGKPQRGTPSLLCGTCCRNETIRRKHRVFISADFTEIRHLDHTERMLLFMYAIGVDITPYLPNRHRHEDIVGTQPDMDDLLAYTDRYEWDSSNEAMWSHKV